MRITVLLILFFSSFHLNADLNWGDFKENFKSKVELPNELEEEISYLNEENFYLYCYNDTTYLTNTNNPEKLRFITPLIGTFKNKNFNDLYNENYNCNITENDINISVLDKKNSVLCINNTSYQHIENGLYPLFKYKRYLKRRVGNPLACSDYKNIKIKEPTIIESEVYCINDFIYFKKNDIENILPLYSELLLEFRKNKNKSYKFNYSDKFHPLFCNGGSDDDYQKSKNLTGTGIMGDFFAEHGKKYKILKVDKKKYLIPIINNIKLPISYERPKYIKMIDSIN